MTGTTPPCTSLFFAMTVVVIVLRHVLHKLPNQLALKTAAAFTHDRQFFTEVTDGTQTNGHGIENNRYGYKYR